MQSEGLGTWKVFQQLFTELQNFSQPRVKWLVVLGMYPLTLIA